MMHPVGPRSAQTYWLRRVVVAVVAVVLVVGVTWWAMSRGASSDASNASESQASGEGTTAAPLTGVLAADPASGATDDPFADPIDPLVPTSGAEPGEAASGDSADAASSSTDDPNPGAAEPADALSSTGAGAASAGETESASAAGQSGAAPAATTSSEAPSSSVATSASAPSAAATVAGDPATTTAPAATPTGGASVVESTNPAPTTVTVTVTKSVAPAPTTTAPPPPSYDASGMLICPDSSIRLTATALASSLFVGAQPRLGLTVTNVGAERCVRDVSGSLQIYTVFDAAGRHVWSTEDCFPGVGHETRVLAPKASASFVIKWAGTSSTPKTCTPRAPVAAGKYTLVAQLGALKSKPLAFTMR